MALVLQLTKYTLKLFKETEVNSIMNSLESSAIICINNNNINKKCDWWKSFSFAESLLYARKILTNNKQITNNNLNKDQRTFFILL